MKQHQAFPGKFLKAADFESGPRTLTIAKVSFDKVNDDESKLVVHFREDERGMVLNKTNFNMIEEITGKDDTDHWPGAVLKVGRVKVDFQGQRVWGVRVIDAGVTAARTDRPRREEPSVDDERSGPDVGDDDTGEPFY